MLLLVMIYRKIQELVDDNDGNTADNDDDEYNGMTVEEKRIHIERKLIIRKVLESQTTATTKINSPSSAMSDFNSDANDDDKEEDLGTSTQGTVFPIALPNVEKSTSLASSQVCKKSNTSIHLSDPIDNTTTTTATETKSSDVQNNNEK